MDTHNQCFITEIRKIMYTPANPILSIYKWGLRGSKLHRHVLVMITGFVKSSSKYNRKLKTNFKM